MKRLKLIGVIVMFVVFLSLVIWWSYARYVECREFGHSVVYCIGR